MKCEFCGGVVSWVGSLIDNPSTKCAGCGRTNCQQVEPASFDDDWAPNPNDDQGAAGVPAWCTLCGKSDHAEAACPTVTSGVPGTQEPKETGNA